MELWSPINRIMELHKTIIVPLNFVWNYNFMSWMWFWRHALAWEHSRVICVACFVWFLCIIDMKLHHTQSSIHDDTGSRFLNMRSDLHLVPNWATILIHYFVNKLSTCDLVYCDVAVQFRRQQTATKLAFSKQPSSTVSEIGPMWL